MGAAKPASLRKPPAPLSRCASRADLVNGLPSHSASTSSQYPRSYVTAVCTRPQVFSRGHCGIFPLVIVRCFFRPHAVAREISVDALFRQIVERVAVDEPRRCCPGLMRGVRPDDRRQSVSAAFPTSNRHGNRRRAAVLGDTICVPVARLHQAELVRVAPVWSSAHRLSWSAGGVPNGVFTIARPATHDFGEDWTRHRCRHGEVVIAGRR